MQRTIAVAMLAATVSAQPKVPVNFYGESLCPACDATVKGPVNSTLTAPGLIGIMDFDFIPFGNAYVKISECKDDQGFNCWMKHCGSDAKTPAADCYTGDIVCQHGSEECYGNLAEVCVKDMLNDDPSKYMPFMYCFEANGKVSTAQMEKCAAIFGLNPNDVATCISGDKGKKLIAVAAKKTAMVPDRDYVPYLEVNGKVLKDSSLLKETVCKDYTGTKPEGCKF